MRCWIAACSSARQTRATSVFSQPCWRPDVAVVLPPEFPSDHSAAEAEVFRKLRAQTPNDWTALHSIGLATHSRKLWAEIDFVVITDRAVLCLEVKGGNLRVDHGTWFAGERRLTHSPFEQAGGAASALRIFLRS